MTRFVEHTERASSRRAAPARPPGARARGAGMTRWRARLYVALCAAVIAAGVTYRAQARLTAVGWRSDLSAPLRATPPFLRGENVYALFGADRAESLPMNYPATALVALAPVSMLPEALAASAFIGIGLGLCAFALTATAWWPLIVLVSWPALLACRTAQWAPLLTAAALIPGLGWLLACKPNVGIALAVQRLDRRWWVWTVAGGAVVLLVSLLLRPDWPMMWWDALSGRADPAAGAERVRGVFLAPIANPLGLPVLLALTRWRRPEARLLVALACVPQVTMGYEALPLLVALPRTRTQALALTLASWLFAIVYATWALQPTVAGTFERARWLLMVFFWLPGLVLVLRRPNAGVVPAWVEQTLIRWRVPERACGRAIEGVVPSQAPHPPQPSS